MFWFVFLLRRLTAAKHKDTTISCPRMSTGAGCAEAGVAGDTGAQPGSQEQVLRLMHTGRLPLCPIIFLIYKATRVGEKIHGNLQVHEMICVVERLFPFS